MYICKYASKEMPSNKTTEISKMCNFVNLQCYVIVIVFYLNVRVGCPFNIHFTVALLGWLCYITKNRWHYSGTFNIRSYRNPIKNVYSAKISSRIKKGSNTNSQANKW